MKRWTLAAAVAVLLFVPPVLAQSNDIKILLDRLDRLERDIKTLNIQLSRGGTVPVPAAAGSEGQAAPPAVNTLAARFEVRLTSIEEDLRSATGQVEELAFLMNGISQRLDKLVADVDYRLSALERKLSASSATTATQAAPAEPPRATAAPSPPSVQQMAPGSGDSGYAKPPGILGTITEADLQAVAPPVESGQPAAAPALAPAAPPASTWVLPEGTPKERYAFARKLLFTQQFDKAEVALREFVESHPDDPLVANARYWLGETYYVRHDFRTAAIVFAEGYQQDKTGKKAPDMLLKLGMALANMGNVEDACRSFAELTKAFPDAPEHIKQGVARQRRNSSCP